MALAAAFPGLARLRRNGAWQREVVVIGLKLRQLHSRIAEECILNDGLAVKVGAWVVSVMQQRRQWARDVEAARHAGLSADFLPEILGKFELIVRTARIVRRESVPRPLQGRAARRARVEMVIPRGGGFRVTLSQ